MEIYDWEPGKYLNLPKICMLTCSVGRSCRTVLLDDVAPRVATLASPQCWPFGKTSTAGEPLEDFETIRARLLRITNTETYKDSGGKGSVLH